MRDATSGLKTRDLDPKTRRSNADRCNHSESEESSKPYKTGDELGNEDEDDLADQSPRAIMAKRDLEAFLEMINSWHDEQDKGDEDELYEKFDYTNPIYEASISELETIILNDIRRSGGGIARRQYRRLQTFIEMATLNGRPKDEQAASKLLYAATYFKGTNYDCCINSCINYVIYPKLKHCPDCGEARNRKDGTPRVQYRVFPLEHRLRLQNSRRERARLMQEYRDGAEKTLKKDGVLTDYWNGLIHKENCEKGLFKDPADMALLLSTDGTKAFRVRIESINMMKNESNIAIDTIRLQCYSCWVPNFKPTTGDAGYTLKHSTEHGHPRAKTTTKH